jgi:hypothetical protein
MSNQLHAAAVIADERRQGPSGGDVDHPGGDLVAERERDQPVAVEIEGEGVAGRQADGAERRRDGAGNAHAWRHQARKAAAS